MTNVRLASVDDPHPSTPAAPQQPGCLCGAGPLSTTSDLALRAPIAAVEIDAAASLIALVDAAVGSIDLPATLTAVARWWTMYWPHGQTALVIATSAGRRGWLATADTNEPLDDCRRQPSDSLRDLAASRLGGESRVAWYPLADQGRVLGGLAVTAAAETPSPPPPWLDLTARLLAHTLHRDERLQSEKLASLAEFAAGAGHEINNPLGTILGRVQLLSRDESHPERLRSLATIGAQALRVRDMIGDLMLFARPPEPQRTRVLWSDLVTEALRGYESEWRARRLTLTGERDPQVAIHADPVQAAVVIHELLRNATRAAPDGSAIDVSIRRSGDDALSLGELQISDSGPGLSPTDQRHLFDPFYSGRQAGRGLGFGLTKCWRIITQHGGGIHVENRSPGLRMTVHWPLS